MDHSSAPAAVIAAERAPGAASVEAQATAAPPVRPATAAALGPALLTLLVLAGLLAMWIGRYDGNLSVLVRFDASNYVYRPEVIPSGAAVLADRGYDGQFFYYVAHDLLARQPGINPMRHQRVGFPLLAWTLGLGDGWGVIAAMVAINLWAPVLTTWLAGRWLARRGLSPWWALVLGLGPGAVLSLYFCLADSLMTLLVWLAWEQLEARQWARSAGWWAATLLTREAMLPALAAGWLWALIHRQGRACLWLAAPAVPFVLWQAYLHHQLGQLPMGRSGGFVGIPLAGVVKYLGALTPGPISTVWLLQVSCVPVILIALATLAWTATRAIAAARAAWLTRAASPSSAGVLSPAALAVILLLGMLLSTSHERIWAHSVTSAGRMLAPAFVFVLFLLPVWPDRLIRALLALTTAMGLVIALGVWRFPVPDWFVMP